MAGPLPRPPRVSVVVPTLDRHEDLARFTASLAAQTVRPHELVVVDAGALPGTDALLLRGLAGTGVALRYARSAPGTSLQRNVAIGLVHGDVVFFFDDDVVLDPDYVERSLECFDDAGTVGVVMGVFKNEQGPPSAARNLYCSVFGLTHMAADDDARMFRSGHMRWSASPSRVIPLPAAAGGMVAYRRECLADQRFAEFLPGYTHNEDVEFSHRVARDGWRIVQTPHARLVHHVSPVNRVKLPERAARMIYGKYWFFKEHQPKDLPHLAAFAWSNVGLAGLFLAGSLVSGDPPPRRMAAGLLLGWRRCVDDLRGRTPGSMNPEAS